MKALPSDSVRPSGLYPNVGANSRSSGGRAQSSGSDDAEVDDEVVGTEAKRYKVRLDRETEFEVEEKFAEREVHESEAAGEAGLEEQAAQEENFE